jgi:hypothetical protein
MRPKVSEHLRGKVHLLVGNMGPFPLFDWRHYYFTEFRRFVPDVYHFVYQNRELSRRQIPQFAAPFRDDGPNGEILPVIVRAPDLQNLTTSYERFLETLRATKLRLDEVSPATAQEIFIDRLAEFIAVGDLSTPPSSETTAPSSVTQTIVNSNRTGDTVIYCQGYFTSTAAGFGVSTPAVGVLSPGRYSFGIINGGLHDFENILWTCPATVQLNKPLSGV